MVGLFLCLYPYSASIFALQRSISINIDTAYHLPQPICYRSSSGWLYICRSVATAIRYSYHEDDPSTSIQPQRYSDPAPSPTTDRKGWRPPAYCFKVGWGWVFSFPICIQPYKKASLTPNMTQCVKPLTDLTPNMTQCVILPCICAMHVRPCAGILRLGKHTHLVVGFWT
jgi:hypothetical protein